MTKRERSQWDEWVKNRAAVPASNMESNPRHASMAEKETPRPDGPVDIAVISYLARERDPDGTCFKYCLDAIVDAGILAGDTPKEVREIKHQQVRVKKGAEKTEVIISW